MHLLLIAAVIQAVSANETWADEERMNTWLGNILNGYEAFERETVTISAAANDGMTNELESFGYESNIIVVEIYHGASWYFGDITYSNGISSPSEEGDNVDAAIADALQSAKNRSTGGMHDDHCQEAPSNFPCSNPADWFT